MKKPGRPVGARIREALAILDSIGPNSSGAVHARMTGVEITNAWKYCSRAVGLGLMTVDRTTTPHTFAAVPGWRDRVGPPPRATKPMLKPVYKPRPCALQDAWRMTA